MANKQVIIHTGFHKTASSSIQHTLAKNRALLSEHGYHYPDLLLSGRRRFYNQSIPLYGLYTEEPQKFEHYWYHNNIDYREANRLISEQFELKLWKQKRLVFSDEFFSSLSEKALYRVKKEFHDQGFSIRIISYIREPLSSLTSQAQQRSRNQSIEKTLLSEPHLKMVSKISFLKRVFADDAEFYSFEKACEHVAGPAGFFFDLLGIHLKPENTIKINEGASMQAVRLASYINSVCPLFISKAQLNPLRKKLDLDPLFSIKGNKFNLLASEMESIKPQLDNVREEIARLLGQDFLPQYGLTNAPDRVTWNAEQISELVKLSPLLDLNLLLRIHDYFRDYQHKYGALTCESISELNIIIQQRLHKESAAQLAKEKRVINDYWQKLKNRLTISIPK